MTKRPIAIAVLSACSLFLAGNALAAGQYKSEAGSAQGMEGGQQTGGLDKSFMDLDANLDGVVSQDEARGSMVLSPSFSQADANADGNIDRSEFSAFESSLYSGAPGTTGGAAGGGISFSSLDVNGDGMISQDEAGAHPNLSSQFTTADADQDGSISESEFSAFEASVGGEMGGGTTGGGAMGGGATGGTTDGGMGAPDSGTGGGATGGGM